MGGYFGSHNNVIRFLKKVAVNKRYLRWKISTSVTYCEIVSIFYGIVKFKIVEKLWKNKRAAHLRNAWLFANALDIYFLFFHIIPSDKIKECGLLYVFVSESFILRRA